MDFSSFEWYPFIWNITLLVHIVSILGICNKKKKTSVAMSANTIPGTKKNLMINNMTVYLAFSVKFYIKNI